MKFYRNPGESGSSALQVLLIFIVMFLLIAFMYIATRLLLGPDRW